MVPYLRVRPEHVIFSVEPMAVEAKTKSGIILPNTGDTGREFGAVYGLVLYSNTVGIASASWSYDEDEPKLERATLILVSQIFDGTPGRSLVPIDGDGLYMRTGQLWAAHESKIILIKRGGQWLPWGDRVMVIPDEQVETKTDSGVILPATRGVPLAKTGRIVALGPDVGRRIIKETRDYFFDDDISIGDRVVYETSERIKEKTAPAMTTSGKEDEEIDPNKPKFKKCVVEAWGPPGRFDVFSEKHALGVLQNATHTAAV